MSQSRQLAAIMFTDIVGYTALMDEDEQKAFELLKKNRMVQRPLIEKFNGRWLKEMGDGVLASFSTVSDAVYCAKEIQKTCQDHPELNLRIGIHLGEVVFEGDDVFGDGVNIASRIEPLSPVGGILVTEAVHNNLLNKKDVESSYVGEEQLKNVKQPVKLYQVHVEGVEPMVIPGPSAAPQEVSTKSNNPRKIAFAVAGVLLILLLSYLLYSNFSTQQQLADAPPKVIDKSIAVLPFKDDSEGGDNQYFCDGMMDEILNHLQKIAELGVKSRTAVEPYRNSDLSFATKAQELDVAFILEGSVRKYGDRFRVTTQLIDVESGNHLWSDTYDGIFSDTIFVVQSHIAKKVAASLSAVITPNEEESIDRVPTTNMAAYDLHLKSLYERVLFWQTHDQKHLKKSHNLIERAIKIDPNYLMLKYDKGATFVAEQNFDSALVYADRVLVEDPESIAAYGLKGDCYYFMGKFDLAIENILKAIDLGGSLWYHVAVARAYDDNNETLKALPHLEKGLEMETTTSVNKNIAWAYLNLGDYKKAKEYSQKAIELGSCSAFDPLVEALQAQGGFQMIRQIADSLCQEVVCEQECYILSYRASLLLGEFEKAEEYFYRWQNAGSDSRFILNRMNYELGYVLYQLGRKEEAGKIFTDQIKRLESKLYEEGNSTFLNLARIFAFMGEKTEALVYLGKYAKQGFNGGQHDFIMIDPFFESLRDNPGLKAIVRQAQEEKAALRAQVREMEGRGELTL